MSDWKNRLVSQSDLMVLSEKLKEKNKKVIFTAGSWDLIHAGQCRYLEKARELGDVLVVGVSSNYAIKKVKGPNKPILDEKIRAEMLTYLKSVDFVVANGTAASGEFTMQFVIDDIVSVGDEHKKLNISEFK